MDKQQLATLEELEALYAKASGKKANIHLSLSSARTILERHLYAERLLKNDYHKVDWSEECKSPKDILNLAYLWMNPLTWRDSSLFDNLVIDGRIAAEVFNVDRFEHISEIAEYIYEQIILAYADSPTVFDHDILEAGFVKGMYDWSPLTWDVMTFLDIVLAGQEIDENELNKTYYNFIRLRYNLQFIAEQRSPKRAAELLHMLKDEWPKIKLNKTGFYLMEAEDIKEFETQLSNNFNDLLSEWGGCQTVLTQDNQLFKYIYHNITDESERLHIHKAVCNAVRLPQMKLVCDALKELMDKNNKKIYSQVDPKAMLTELRRLGLPDESTKGFSDKNFYSFFNG